MELRAGSGGGQGGAGRREKPVMSFKGHYEVTEGSE